MFRRNMPPTSSGLKFVRWGIRWLYMQTCWERDYNNWKDRCMPTLRRKMMPPSSGAKCVDWGTDRGCIEKFLGRSFRITWKGSRYRRFGGKWCRHLQFRSVYGNESVGYTNRRRFIGIREWTEPRATRCHNLQEKYEYIFLLYALLAEIKPYTKMLKHSGVLHCSYPIWTGTVVRW
jgi:hypothetical protein